jgi:hypothetical protein
MTQTAVRSRRPLLALVTSRLVAVFAVLGPGFVTANVDNDPGGILTYSQAGAKFGYQLLWTLIPTTIALMVVQEMAARMGAITGKGLSDLIREEFGLRATFFTMVVLGFADFGNIIAEFAGLASGMGIFGATKYIVVPAGAVLVWSLPGFSHPGETRLGPGAKADDHAHRQQRSGLPGDDHRTRWDHHYTLDAVLSSGCCRGEGHR